MKRDRQARTYDAIVRVVLAILESEGYDAVQPRVVAKRARVSLTTIYKLFPSRDVLIVTARCQWMEANCYSRFADPPPLASLYEGQMWVYRQLFEPWQKHPRILEAFHRARTSPAGEPLDKQGEVVVAPVVAALLEKVDPTYAQDFGLIMTNMVCGVIQRFALGELPVSDLLPVLERTLFRLTTDNEALVAARASRAHPRTRRKRKAAR